MLIKKFLFILLFQLGVPAALGLAADPDSEQKPEYKRTSGLGFAYTGGLLRWGFKRVWSLEPHFLFGSADSNDGNVSSQVMGIRGYRHFRTDKPLQLFFGPELDYISAKSQNLKSTGILAGGFAGVEYYVLSRLSIGFDLGAYYLSMKEKSLNTSESGIDFILNTFLNFYIF